MERENKKKGDKRWIWALLGCILIIVSIVSVLLFLMQGKTTSTEGGGSVETVQALACEGTGVKYPFFKHDDADSRKMKINATFNQDKLDTISFVYQITYNDKSRSQEEFKKIRDYNYSDVSSDFQNNGLSVEALGVRFTTLENGAQMSLYAYSRELSNISSKYFLLDSASGSYRINNLKKIYEEKGLKCSIHDTNEI